MVVVVVLVAEVEVDEGLKSKGVHGDEDEEEG